MTRGGLFKGCASSLVNPGSFGPQGAWEREASTMRRRTPAAPWNPFPPLVLMPHAMTTSMTWMAVSRCSRMRSKGRNAWLVWTGANDRFRDDRCGSSQQGAWAAQLKLSRGANVAAVALANKNARGVGAALQRPELSTNAVSRRRPPSRRLRGRRAGNGY